MAANAGSNVILKVHDGAVTYTQAALMKDITFDWAAGMADITNQQSGGDRELLAGTGINGFDVSFSAVYDTADTTGIQKLRTAHLARALISIQITDGTETFQCDVEVVSISRSADVIGTDAEQVSVTLKSSGAITIT